VSGVIDPLIAAALQKRPRELGHDTVAWTETLLVRHLKHAHGLEVCRKSVSLALGRLEIGWGRRRQSEGNPSKFSRASGIMEPVYADT